MRKDFTIFSETSHTCSWMNPGVPVLPRCSPFAFVRAATNKTAGFARLSDSMKKDEVWVVLLHRL